MRKLLILAAGLLILPAASQAETLEELLVEKGVITKGEAQAAMHSGNAKVYWNEGTRLEFPDTGFTVKFNTQVQARYTYNNNDSADNTSSFDMQRVRLAVSGTALHGEFDYRLEADFVGDPDGDEDGTTSEPDLRDAYLQWNACDWVNLRMGQFKEAIGHQMNVHSAFLQFPDRSIVANTFATGTDGRRQGLRAGFEPAEGFTLGAAIFNGDGVTRNNSNGDTRMGVVVDTRFDVTGDIDSSVEGDIDHSDEFGMDIGAAYAYGENKSDTPLTVDDAKLHRVSVDTTMKVSGFSLTGEFFWSDETADFIGGGRAVDSTPLGFYAQAGYFLSEDWELAARWGVVDCDDGKAVAGSCDGGGTDKAQEASASLNYFFWQHYLKAQLAYSYLTDEPVVGEDVDDSRIVFQLSGYM